MHSEPASVGIQGAPDPDTSPGAAYSVVTVASGATLHGRVRWQGEVPQQDAMMVAAHGDPEHCGATQPLRPLEISDEGGVSNAVVYLADIQHGVAPTLSPVTIDQHHCRYTPRVTTVNVGAELRFTNNDQGVLHNVHGYYGVDGDDAWFNAASPTGVTITRSVLRSGIVRLQCDAGHTWMLAYVHAFNHPYHTVTDATGHFEIRDVPAGIYRVRMWHEGWQRTISSGNPRPVFEGHTEIQLPATLTAGATTNLEFVMSR
jgi:plastocyanin